jgi:outer membrane protein
MRLNLRAALAALALAAGTSGVAAAQQAPLKIAYVNTQALLDVAPGRAAAESTFEKEANGYRVQLKTLSDSLNAVIANYNKAEPSLTPAQKDTRTRSIRDLEQAFQDKQNQLQQQAQQRQNELMAPIMEQVKKVLDDIRAEDGYALILANDPGQSVIVSADKNLDITDRVVARLRTLSAPQPGAKSGAVPSPSGVTRPKKPQE